MGHKLAVDELGLDETVLPLADLSGIRRGDALRLDWPRADAIIGNPPYHGTKLMRSELGDDYVEWLKREFAIGVKDYAVYWFRKAHGRLEPGGRAGLVATNSIREGKNREATLDWLVAKGAAIASAVSDQEWAGEANVHVSIVNWVEKPSQPVRCVLDGVPVTAINSTLRPRTESTIGHVLAENRGRQFFGVVPTGSGFILGQDEADALLVRHESDYSEVVRPYLGGDDITKNPHLAPTRWIIDFGEMPLEDAARWPAALAIVRERVKPERDRHTKRRERDEWWKFSRTVRDLFAAVEGRPRFVATPHTAKRFFMVWCEPHWCPGNSTAAFAFDDDYSIGVLSTRAHTAWAVDQSTTLETRPRYTTASFLTFPWPRPSSGQRVDISELARRTLARRSEICLDRQIGLTRLYNEVDDGAYRDLRELHVALDEAVAAAYGWPASAAHDPQESNRLLLELNREIAAGRIPYDPFR
jgi:hypothetical protein